MTCIYWAILWLTVLFKTHQCVNITNCHGYRNVKSGPIPPFRRLWTTFLPNAPSKLGCLGVSVMDEHCGGFLYDTDTGLCTGVDTRAEHPPTKPPGRQTSQSPLPTVTTTIVFYSIGQRTREDEPNDIAPGMANFRFFVQTGNGSEDGADPNLVKVFVILTGKAGTVEMELKHPTNTDRPFQRGSNDTYEFTSSNIGDIVTVKTRGKSVAIGDAWVLKKIMIEQRVKHRDHSISVNIYLAELGDIVTNIQSMFNFVSAPVVTKTLRLRTLKQYSE